MKQKELMIGDLVRCKSNIIQIETHWDIYNAEDFEPIPITKEILEADGFKFFENESGCQVWIIDNFGEYSADSVFVKELKYNKKHKWVVDFSIYGEGSGRMFIDYVHELRHILKMCKINMNVML